MRRQLVFDLGFDGIFMEKHWPGPLGHRVARGLGTHCGLRALRGSRESGLIAISGASIWRLVAPSIALVNWMNSRRLIRDLELERHAVSTSTWCFPVPGLLGWQQDLPTLLSRTHPGDED